MSAHREDDSRPGRESKQRNTSRDVPAAKYKEGSVGTVAPRGLRGPSLLPGQGAPERVNPEDVELAVLRDAETLDGPNVGRAAAKRLPDARSPAPTPVSVEVPRVRSVPPGFEDRPSTPPSPSARSIQSGTLMSMGSVDPRAPTELSLPSPRPLSVSERVAYLGPEAVVDRTPSYTPRELPGVVDSPRATESTQRPSAPSSRSHPNSSPRSVPVGSGAAPSARALPPSPRPDSIAPPAQNYARQPRSYSPVAPSVAQRDSRPSVPSSRRNAPPSVPDVPPQFQIHSELDALPRDFRDDAFDLRSASTQREPLASRKPLPSSDWTPHGPVSGGRDSQPSVRSSRHSSSAVTVLGDRTRDTAPPTTERVHPAQRASVPLSWVLGAAAFAVLLALIVAWAMRPSVSQDAARPAEGRASAAAPNTAAQPAPHGVTPPSVPDAPPAPSAGSAAAPGGPAARAPNAPNVKVAPVRPAASAPSGPASAAPADSAGKVHQSIY